MVLGDRQHWRPAGAPGVAGGAQHNARSQTRNLSVPQPTRGRRLSTQGERALFCAVAFTCRLKSHPDFEGSFSLKTVLPALVPDLGYSDLAITDGDTASRELTHRVLPDAPFLPADRALTREQLLRYCERDTLAMVRVLSRLRELA